MYPPGFTPPVGTAIAPPTAPAPQIPMGRTASPQEMLYPPGHAKQPERQRSKELRPTPSTSKPASVDPLLPPTSGGAHRQPEANDLLPPGASSSPISEERMPLPAAIPNRSPKDAVLIPTEQGYVGVRAPVKTIVHRGQEIELRQLTPEEKSRRRAVRNAILFVFCVVVLIVVTAAFMWK
jgi:hypothetical protein